MSRRLGPELGTWSVYWHLIGIIEAQMKRLDLPRWGLLPDSTLPRSALSLHRLGMPR